ncbi:MAG: hypothetical protein QOJ09_2388 [Actinomycetota bacterium]|nr:hypothetical protein [Actinomycetota bacterium]
MTIVDVIVLVVVVGAAVHGLWLGASTQVLSFLGTGVGLVIGALVAPHVVPQATSGTTQALLALAIVFGAASLGGGAGRTVGVRVWGAVRRVGAAHVDAALGAVVGAVGSLLASWIVASMLLTVPLPGVADAVQRSVVLRLMDRVLPPAPELFARVQGLLGKNGLPPVFADFEPEPATPVQPPPPGEVAAAAARGRASTVKIKGLACSYIEEGSGVVVGAGLVVTNAHVVAGASRPVVYAGGRVLAATPVLFDPDLDLALLRVSGLAAPALRLAPGDVPRGAHGAALGYPGDGPFHVEPAAVRRAFDAIGRDIYNRRVVHRPVYELQAHLRPGNSGGPVVAADGTVIGIVFSKSAFRDDIGYAIRSSAVVARVRAAGRAPVGTGACT